MNAFNWSVVAVLLVVLCMGLHMTDSLPRPTVTSKSSQDGDAHSISVTITRESGKGRVYTGVGSSVSGAARDLVEKMLEDPHSAEFVKKG